MGQDRTGRRPPPLSSPHPGTPSPAAPARSRACPGRGPPAGCWGQRGVRPGGWGPGHHPAPLLSPHLRLHAWRQTPTQQPRSWLGTPPGSHQRPTHSLCRSSEELRRRPPSKSCPSSCSLSSTLSSFGAVASPFTGAERSGGTEGCWCTARPAAGQPRPCLDSARGSWPARRAPSPWALSRAAMPPAGLPSRARCVGARELGAAVPRAPGRTAELPPPTHGRAGLLLRLLLGSLLRGQLLLGLVHLGLLLLRASSAGLLHRLELGPQHPRLEPGVDLRRLLHHLLVGFVAADLAGRLVTVWLCLSPRTSPHSGPRRLPPPGPSTFFSVATTSVFFCRIWEVTCRVPSSSRALRHLFTSCEGESEPG